MALGIKISQINLNELVDPLFEKSLRKMSEGELNLFNADLQNIASQYAAEPIRALLEKHQLAILALCRGVMYSAKQPYGGANALGSEITMRLIRPIDVDFTLHYMWDRNLSGEVPGTAFIWQGQATGGADAMSEEEGNIILGFVNPVPVPAVSAYQLITNGNRTYPYYTLSFSHFRSDALAVVECMAPIMEWPEESYQINMIPAYAINPDRLQAIGIHFARARAWTTAAGTA